MEATDFCLLSLLDNAYKLEILLWLFRLATISLLTHNNHCYIVLGFLQLSESFRLLQFVIFKVALYYLVYSFSSLIVPKLGIIYSSIALHNWRCVCIIVLVYCFLMLIRSSHGVIYLVNYILGQTFYVSILFIF